MQELCSTIMPHEGAIIFRDLVGKLDVLNVECEECGRRGRYHLHRLIERYGIDAKGATTMVSAVVITDERGEEQRLSPGDTTMSPSPLRTQPTRSLPHDHPKGNPHEPKRDGTCCA
jgi:hypothetical protein